MKISSISLWKQNKIELILLLNFNFARLYIENKEDYKVNNYIINCFIYIYIVVGSLFICIYEAFNSIQFICCDLKSTIKN
jgi:hypothetical protein